MIQKKIWTSVCGILLFLWACAVNIPGGSVPEDQTFELEIVRGGDLEAQDIRDNNPEAEDTEGGDPATNIPEVEIAELEVGEAEVGENNIPAADRSRDLALWAIAKPQGLGTDPDVGTRYLISTWRDLEYISGNFTDNTELLEFDYVVTADITFPDLGNAPLSEDGMYATSGFIPIGTEEHPFSGTFDGGERTINHLVIDRKDSDSVGLFGRVQGIPEDKACIKGVRLEDIKVTGKNNVGALIGEAGNDIELENNRVNGVVEGKGNIVGGLIGHLDWNDGVGDNLVLRVAIRDVSASGKVKSEGNKVGGLIGSVTLINFDAFINAEINTVHATGDVTGNHVVGGLIGGVALIGTIPPEEVAIQNVYASGAVSGESTVGGLIGSLGGMNLGRTYATGNVSGHEDIGGLIGLASESSVHTSYATGNVSGHEDIGGLIGLASESSVHTSYATGNVDGSTNVGGFIGNMDAASTIENSYSTADVSRNTSHGLFIGIKGDGMTTATTPSTNFVKGEDGAFMNVLLEDNGVGIDPVAGENFTEENFNWTFGGENSMWHWLEDGKWPILKWQRED